MTWIRRFFWLELLTAAASLVIGYVISGWLIAAGVVIFLGAIWAAVRLRGGSGLAGLLLYLFLFIAAAGFWAGSPGWLMLLTSVAALGAWDLDHFLQRLSEAEYVEFETGLGRDHLTRLFLVQGLGFAAGFLALIARPQIGFWWAVLLAMLAVIGLSRIVAYVRREAE